MRNVCVRTRWGVVHSALHYLFLVFSSIPLHSRSFLVESLLHSWLWAVVRQYWNQCFRISSPTWSVSFSNLSEHRAKYFVCLLVRWLPWSVSLFPDQANTCVQISVLHYLALNFPMMNIQNESSDVSTDVSKWVWQISVKERWKIRKEFTGCCLNHLCISCPSLVHSDRRFHVKRKGNHRKILLEVSQLDECISSVDLLCVSWCCPEITSFLACSVSDQRGRRPVRRFSGPSGAAVGRACRRREGAAPSRWPVGRRRRRCRWSRRGPGAGTRRRSRAPEIQFLF